MFNSRVDLNIVCAAGGDTVRLEFTQAGEKVLYVNLTRDMAKHWGELLIGVSESYQIGPAP